MHDPSSPDPSGKKQRLLDAAAAVFLAHGYSAATTDMIQRQAGVSKATLYATVGGKEAMFAAVIERQCARMAASIQAIKPAPGDLARTLSELGHAYLTTVVSEVGLNLFRVVVAESSRFPDLSRRFYLAGPRVVTMVVVAHLEQAVQAGAVDVHTVGVEAAASQFVNLVRAEGQLECLMHPEARPSTEQMDRWVRMAVETFLARFGRAPAG
jgi:AcrR family transcriptional regulator